MTEDAELQKPDDTELHEQVRAHYAAVASAVAAGGRKEDAFTAESRRGPL